MNKKNETSDPIPDKLVQKQDPDADIKKKEQGPAEEKSPAGVLYESRLAEAGLSHKEKRRLRREKMRAITADMSKSEKLKYYIFYYKGPVIVSVIILAFLIYLGRALYLNGRPKALSFAFLNPRSDVTLDAFQDYLKDRGYDDSYRLESASYYVSQAGFEYNAARGAQNANYLQLPVMAEGDEYDFMLTDAKGLDYASRNEIAIPLSAVLSGNLRSELQEKEVLVDAKGPADATLTDAPSEDAPASAYGISSSTDAEKPSCYAVNLSGTSFAAELHDGSPLYLIVTGKSKECLNRTEDFLTYIFSLNP